jgi:hypothetical protein
VVFPVMLNLRDVTSNSSSLLGSNFPCLYPVKRAPKMGGCSGCQATPPPFPLQTEI